MRRAPGIPRLQRHLLREAPLPAEAAADEALADARDLEQAVEPVEDRVRALRDVREAVAAEVDDHVVLLEDRVGRVAREPDRVEQRRLVRTEIARRMARPGACDVAVEVRDSPADGEAQPGRRRCEAPVDRPERLLELALRVEQGRPRPADAQLRGDELMVERRNDDLDAVVRDHGHVEQEMLLGREGGAPWRRAPVVRSRRRARTGRRRRGLQRRSCRGSLCASRRRARLDPSRRGPALWPVPAERSGSRRPVPPSRPRRWCRPRPTSTRSSGT